jgi:acyloxyacyl hydrolase
LVQVYPGRVAPSSRTAPGADTNCNGIYGADPSGKFYEDKFCSTSDRRGIALLGDSAGAHFEIPPRWFNVSEWERGTFEGALSKVEDELDLPYRSYGTGFEPNGTYGPVDSLYLHNRRRNLCNHR